MYLTVHVDISFSKFVYNFFYKIKSKNVAISNYMRYGRDDEVKITVHKIASVKL